MRGGDINDDARRSPAAARRPAHHAAPVQHDLLGQFADPRVLGTRCGAGSRAGPTRHPADAFAKIDPQCKANCIEIEKGYAGKRPRTWITLTAAGETALRDEIRHLKQLIHQVESAPGE